MAVDELMVSQWWCQAKVCLDDGVSNVRAAALTTLAELVPGKGDEEASHGWLMAVGGPVDLGHGGGSQPSPKIR